MQHALIDIMQSALFLVTTIATYHALLSDCTYNAFMPHHNYLLLLHL